MSLFSKYTAANLSHTKTLLSSSVINNGINIVYYKKVLSLSYIKWNNYAYTIILMFINFNKFLLHIREIIYNSSTKIERYLSYKLYES